MGLDSWLVDLPDKKRKSSPVKDYLDASALGIELVVSVLIGAGAGYWLDKRLKTFPWFTVIGVALGAAAGFLSAYRAFFQGDDGEGKE